MMMALMGPASSPSSSLPHNAHLLLAFSKHFSERKHGLALLFVLSLGFHSSVHAPSFGI